MCNSRGFHVRVMAPLCILVLLFALATACAAGGCGTHVTGFEGTWRNSQNRAMQMEIVKSGDHFKVYVGPKDTATTIWDASQKGNTLDVTSLAAGYMTFTLDGDRLTVGSSWPGASSGDPLGVWVRD